MTVSTVVIVLGVILISSMFFSKYRIAIDIATISVALLGGIFGT